MIFLILLLIGGVESIKSCIAKEPVIEPECWLHCHPLLSPYVSVEICCSIAGHRLSGTCSPDGKAICECAGDSPFEEYLPIKK
ncbi:unnamed protein product, partial [Mesorhabditis belari]|uniref:Uncharacterized protein n=1 Tax=Mesorhabditis belari TaxID=2138241 RepID=A0AAF3F3B0_9BILA